MKESLEELEQFAIDVILNRRKGFRAGAIRILLSLMSIIYRNLVSFRLWLYKVRIKREHNLGCLVVSIGNLTVGGTGKTPISIEICKYLKALNQNPVVIKKKYQDQDDEIFLIKKYSKIMVSKKRSEAINKAIEKNYNFAVLDDGYQDQSIKKDLSLIHI